MSSETTKTDNEKLADCHADARREAIVTAYKAICSVNCHDDLPFVLAAVKARRLDEVSLDRLISKYRANLLRIYETRDDDPQPAVPVPKPKRPRRKAKAS